MSKLFEAKQRIDRAIAELGLDPFKTKGAIGLRAGFLIGLVNERTPDDDKKLDKLRSAAREILGMNL
ncbi:MAG: hypothetical protein HY903_04350 [Deltaproteobacteria bacterium]|nr:hypothetical protein [Deltaproteobacteria bacterium]